MVIKFDGNQLTTSSPEFLIDNDCNPPHRATPSNLLYSVVEQTPWNCPSFNVLSFLHLEFYVYKATPWPLCFTSHPSLRQEPALLYSVNQRKPQLASPP
ncbi:unnamed protein product [Arabidopsis lyrata]|uniref:Predicted protein n=1 Tax=Arabidopsis lyrata subsp. lyrata TaxID=81972 RepID=D7MB21_ARALL|nr:predicted protein [Arabidopsis lyrata subsp. lyrata]CAH8274072.1 unnamed protein product [Arabidopsis lyrata]